MLAADLPPAPERPRIGLRAGVAALALAVALALLPIWDALEKAAVFRAASGTSLAGPQLYTGPIPSATLKVVVSLVLALAAGVVLLVQQRWWVRHFVIATVAAAALSYAAITLVHTTRTRSSAAMSFGVCEDWDAGQQAHWQRTGAHVSSSRIHGPHWPNGWPCTPRGDETEIRRRHARDGSVMHGLRMIATRFTYDRRRVFEGSASVVVLLLLAAFLVHDPWWRRSVRPSPPPAR